MRKLIGIMGVLLLLGGLLSETALAGEYRAEGWPVIDLEVAAQVKGRIMRKDLIEVCPGVDIEQELYVVNTDNLSPRVKEAYGIDLPKGTIIMFIKNSLIETGQTVGYYMDSNGVDPMDITIVDDKGDGVFRMKYGPEDFPIPQWIADICR